MAVDPNSIDLPAFVADGASVTNGQQIGEVGDLDNTRGCHLHFEVHPDGGTIYQDPRRPDHLAPRERRGHQPSPQSPGY